MDDIAVQIKKRIRTIFSISMIVVFLLDIFFIEVTWVSLIIIAFAFVPWILPYLKADNLPFGLGVDTKALASDIGLLNQAPKKENLEQRLEQFKNENRDNPLPNLLMVRRQLEIELREVFSDTVDTRHVRIGDLIKKLKSSPYLGNLTVDQLDAAMRVANSAAHGAAISGQAIKDATAVIMDVLENLGQRKC